MTRKDYNLIAQAITETREAVGNDSAVQETLDLTTDRLANWLSAENPGFDRTKFLKACKAPTP